MGDSIISNKITLASSTASSLEPVRSSSITTYSNISDAPTLLTSPITLNSDQISAIFGLKHSSIYEDDTPILDKKATEKLNEQFRGYKYVPRQYKPKRIIYNDPATIVFWEDGTKTVVKRAKGEKFNKYNAFTAALAKKMFGNNSRVNKVVAEGIEQKPIKKTKK